MPLPESTYALYAHEDDLPSFDRDAAFSRLARAIACKTVCGDEHDDAQFARLHNIIRTSFPAIASSASIEEFGNNLLISVIGGDPSLEPLILIAHQDVVPAHPNEWEHPPFGGFMDDEFIWGRGALDIKGMMFAELEALEWVLSTGKRPSRTVFLAFGDDEETVSEGAVLLASVLESRGVHDAFLIDEGTTTYVDGASFGALGTLLQGMCLSQKGFLTVRLSAMGQGGHSSNPYGGTSLEKIADAISALRAAMPAPRYTPLLSSALEQLGVVADDTLLGNLVNTREAYPYVADTMAVTQIGGSASSANILPANASATINFRLLPGTDMETFIGILRSALPDGVEMEIVHGTPSGRSDQPSGALYERLVASFERSYPDVAFVPLFMCGGCDAIRYEAVTATSVRVLPYLADPADQGRIHGANERISKRSYLQSIQVLVHFLEDVLFS